MIIKQEHQTKTERQDTRQVAVMTVMLRQGCWDHGSHESCSHHESCIVAAMPVIAVITVVVVMTVVAAMTVEAIISHDSSSHHVSPCLMSGPYCYHYPLPRHSPYSVPRRCTWH